MLLSSTPPPTAENIAEGRFSMSLTRRIHVRSKARPVPGAPFNHVDWGAASIATTRGVNLLGFGIVLHVALGPCSTMPIFFPHALRFRLHRSVVAVKVVDLTATMGSQPCTKLKSRSKQCLLGRLCWLAGKQPCFSI